MDELNDHVRHMLHSRRSKFKRSMKGFGQYVRKREYTYMEASGWRLICYSSWILHYSICHSDYTLRSGMGALLDW